MLPADLTQEQTTQGRENQEATVIGAISETATPVIPPQASGRGGPAGQGRAGQGLAGNGENQLPSDLWLLPSGQVGTVTAQVRETSLRAAGPGTQRPVTLPLADVFHGGQV